MQVIKYKKINRTKVGTESNPKWHEYELEKQIPWSEANEEFAKAEACNGEYTIVDDGIPEPEPIIPEDTEEVWDELALALKEGVDSI